MKQKNRLQFVISNWHYDFNLLNPAIVETAQFIPI